LTFRPLTLTSNSDSNFLAFRDAGSGTQYGGLSA
jgi:hypothetical protein